MKFEWDEAKNKLNFQKHLLDFKAVQPVFTQPLSLIYDYQDVREDYGEIRRKRFAILNGLLLCVVYTRRAGEIRIISARRANHKERKEYEQHVNG